LEDGGEDFVDLTLMREAAGRRRAVSPRRWLSRPSTRKFLDGLDDRDIMPDRGGGPDRRVVVPSWLAIFYAGAVDPEAAVFCYFEYLRRWDGTWEFWGANSLDLLRGAMIQLVRRRGLKPSAAGRYLLDLAREMASDLDPHAEEAIVAAVQRDVRRFQPSAGGSGRESHERPRRG
jgi:hypothetical protein